MEKPTNEGSMENAEANKAFILEMLREKKQLKDFPDKVSDTIVIHEPSSLPFGGTYRGLKEFEQFYPEVLKFYDFSRFELLNIYAESDVVFVIIKAGIAHTTDHILLCEQFTFKQGKLNEIRLFIHDFEGKPIQSLINR